MKGFAFGNRNNMQMYTECQVITPNQRFILYLRLEGARRHSLYLGGSCTMTHNIGIKKKQLAEFTSAESAELYRSTIHVTAYRIYPEFLV